MFCNSFHIFPKTLRWLRVIVLAIGVMATYLVLHLVSYISRKVTTRATPIFTTATPARVSCLDQSRRRGLKQHGSRNRSIERQHRLQRYKRQQRGRQRRPQWPHAPRSLSTTLSSALLCLTDELGLAAGFQRLTLHAGLRGGVL